MSWLRVVVGVGIGWLLSIAVCVGAMELGHRIVLTIDRDAIPADHRIVYSNSGAPADGKN